MKWLILTDDPHLRGGLQSCCRELAAAALDRGDEVDFLCFKVNCYQELAGAYSTRCRVNVAPQMDTRSIRLRSLLLAWQCLRRSRPDALFLCSAAIPNFFPFLLLSTAAGVRNVICHFGADMEFPSHQPSRKYFFGMVPGIGWWRKELMWSARIAYRNMTLGLFNNDQQLANWRIGMEFNASKLTVWNYPIDIHRFSPSPIIRAEVRKELGISDDEFVVGGVGTLCPQKSFDLAISAFAQFRAQWPNAWLILVGDGVERSKLERLSRVLDVHSRVRFLGQRDDVQRLMNAFDVFCLPSTHAHETLGIVFLEAQATGVPIVVPNLPGPRRVALDGRAGKIVDVGNASAYADAWLQIALDPEQRRTLVSAGLNNAREFERSRVYRWLLDRMNTCQSSRYCRNDAAGSKIGEVVNVANA